MEFGLQGYTLRSCAQFVEDHHAVSIVDVMSQQQLQHGDTGGDDEDIAVSLRQKVWQGKLPTKISLAANESKSFMNTAPLYVFPPVVRD
jgi:hypothetical protein